MQNTSDNIDNVVFVCVYVTVNGLGPGVMKRQIRMFLFTKTHKPYAYILPVQTFVSVSIQKNVKGLTDRQNSIKILLVPPSW